jgi:hypothetical protein
MLLPLGDLKILLCTKLEGCFRLGDHFFVDAKADLDNAPTRLQKLS